MAGTAHREGSQARAAHSAARVGGRARSFQDAGFETENLSVEERQRIGVELGTGGGGLPFVEDHYGIWYNGRSHSKASIYIIPAATHGTLSSELSMAFGLRGLSHVVSTGCTSSTDAIAYAAQHVALGRQDMMLAGGVDAPLAPGILAGFNLLTVLTTDWNDDPEHASRPFTRNRSGMVLGRRRLDVRAGNVRERETARRENLC